MSAPPPIQKNSELPSSYSPRMDLDSFTSNTGFCKVAPCSWGPTCSFCMAPATPSTDAVPTAELPALLASLPNNPNIPFISRSLPNPRSLSNLRCSRCLQCGNPTVALYYNRVYTRVPSCILGGGPDTVGGLWLRVLRAGGGYLSSTNSSNTDLTLTLLPPVALLSPVLPGRLSLPCLPLPALWSHPKKFDPLPVSYCPAFPASPLQPNCNMDYCVVRRDANPPGSYYVTLRELLD